jgi:hypothetical protein
VLLKELLIFTLVQESPMNKLRLPHVKEHIQLRKGTRSFTEVFEWDVGRPTFTDDTITLNNIAPVVCPLHEIIDTFGGKYHTTQREVSRPAHCVKNGFSTGAALKTI